MTITVYGDELRDYGLITEEDNDFYSMFNVVDVPENYVYMWYAKNQDVFDTETEYEFGFNHNENNGSIEDLETYFEKLGVDSFEYWFNNVYICEDFIGFFTFIYDWFQWLPSRNNITPY